MDALVFKAKASNEWDADAAENLSCTKIKPAGIQINLSPPSPQCAGTHRSSHMWRLFPPASTFPRETSR